MEFYSIQTDTHERNSNNVLLLLLIDFLITAILYAGKLLGAKYLVIVSSRSLKMREINFAQFHTGI